MPTYLTLRLCLCFGCLSWRIQGINIVVSTLKLDDIAVLSLVRAPLGFKTIKKEAVNISLFE